MKLFHYSARSFLLTILSLLISGLILAGCLYFYMIIQLPNVATLKDVHLQMPLKIYTSDGKLIGEYGEMRRTPVTFDQVPKLLVKAIIATEDRRFYDHPGVDFIGLVRASKELILTGQKSQGASTITMQVARNFFLTRKKTFTRKFNEILLALKLNSTFSKQQILELYLNKIYLGERAYGVASAAQVYYGKNLNQLTLSEMAMIAGLPQAPSRNNPITNPEAAKIRRDIVLKNMLDEGYITKEQYQEAVNTPIHASYHGPKIAVSAPYVGEMVRNEIVNRYGDQAYTEGFDVYTTIDSKLQIAANQALHNGLLAYSKRHGGRKIPEGALISLNPNNGAILALVGGFENDENGYNRAVQANRQPGSNFKPFIYAAALDKGYTLATVINDAPVVVDDTGSGQLWRPHNDEMKFFGPTRLRVALAESRNLVSVRLLQLIGVPYAIDYASRFGFDPKSLPNGLSLALGSADVTPMQIVTGYAVFANGGYKINPYFIEQILNSDGKAIFQAKPTVVCTTCSDNTSPTGNPVAPRVIPEDVAYLMTSAMQSVVEHGTGHEASSLGRQDIAGKTGTSNSQNDAWFSGFNSNIVTTVWVGYDQPRSLYEFGAQAALPIWLQYMKIALAGQPEAIIKPPADIITVRIDPTTGLLAKPDQENAMFEVFRKQDAPTAESSAQQENTFNSGNTPDAKLF